MGTLCNQVVYYGLGETYSVRGKDIVYDGESTCYTCVYLDKEYPVKLNLLGIHNVYDSLAAAAAGLSLGVDMDHIVEALKNFKPIGQRQTILNIHGSRFWMIPIMQIHYPWRWHFLRLPR